MTHLIDTNVLSELPKPKPNASVVAWMESLDEIVVSAISVEELAFGVERAAPAKERVRLREWLDSLLGIPPTVVAVDARVARLAGNMRAQREAKGRRVAQADMLIAACALSQGLVLATRNVRDFEGCGLALFDPFAAG